MNQLATVELSNLDLDKADLSFLYSISDSKPRLAELKLNKDTSIEHNGKLVSVSAPGVKVENADFGEAYGSDVQLRIFVATMQTSVFDQDEGAYTNFSQHFFSYAESALDWHGGNKCGWIPSRERDSLKGVDPVAYANASKVKLSRNLFGLVTIADAKTLDGKSVEVKDLPFRLRLGPSNFFEISEVIKKMMRQSCPPMNFPVKLNYRLDKRGSNKYIVLSYEPIMAKRYPLGVLGAETLQNFQDLIKNDDERVVDKMRANMVTKMEDGFSDVTDSGE
mgnify:FL=1|tara:strand:- start:4163 stop:4996 length:834 start_codon:yes stop_codon:yes gene_type:complete